MAKISRARLVIELSPEVRRRLRVAAARRDMTLQDYVRRAVERQVEDDARDALHAADDPVLAALWANEANDVYDDL